MKVKLYISMGKRKGGTFCFKTTLKKSYVPIFENYVPLPTVCFPITLNLPDNIFDGDPTIDVIPKISQIKSTSKKLGWRIHDAVRKEVRDYKTDKLTR